MNTNHHPRSTFLKSSGILLALFLGAVAFFHFYDAEKPFVAPKTELKKPVAKPAEFPKGQMEDAPALEDLPMLANVPAPTKKTDLIKIESLHSGDTVQSPLVVSGVARGNWFFEASFPIKILDKNGKVIGQGNGQTQGDWMVESFVPWKATVSFIAPTSNKKSDTGEVVFMKDNPSELPENDAEVRVPILFAHPQ